MSDPVVIVIGTRPEAIKLAPVYFELKKQNIPAVICATNQHANLLDEVFACFGITPDYSLHIMKEGQDLAYVTQAVLEKTTELYRAIKPRMVIVQGDTTTAFTAALAAYYVNIPVGHVEAGLRTGDRWAPYPEEFNRHAIALISHLNFAPTSRSIQALTNDGMAPETIYLTGNTIVDALHWMQNKLNVTSAPSWFKQLDDYRRTVLVTLHRRESFGGGLERVLSSIKEYAQQHEDVLFVYPRHPNPSVVKAIETVGLDDVSNIQLLEPVGYEDLVRLLMKADLVLTDSGGIQEEAISLGKTVIVAREKTERMEGVDLGLAHLVGTDPQKVNEALVKHIDDEPQVETNVYGDGRAAEKIVSIIQESWTNNEESVCHRARIHRAPNSNHSG